MVWGWSAGNWSEVEEFVVGIEVLELFVVEVVEIPGEDGVGATTFLVGIKIQTIMIRKATMIRGRR